MPNSSPPPLRLEHPITFTSPGTRNWKVLDVRHAIDVMHLMNNLCVNLIAFLGVYGKIKDTLEAHQELQRIEERDVLHPQQRDNGREHLSPASYTLSK